MRFCTPYLRTSTSKDWSSTPITMASESRGPQSCEAQTSKQKHLYTDDMICFWDKTSEKGVINVCKTTFHKLSAWAVKILFPCPSRVLFVVNMLIDDLVTHLYKHSKEELRAELLDSLGHSLLVITVGCLLLDIVHWQAQMRAAICMQTFRHTHGYAYKRRY